MRYEYIRDYNNTHNKSIKKENFELQYFSFKHTHTHTHIKFYNKPTIRINNTTNETGAM